jgi:hypothetical protein
MHSIARVVLASAALLSLAVAPAMARRGGGGGFHGGMMGPHGFHDGHFHDGHFHGHGFFPWWGSAPFAYGAYATFWSTFTRSKWLRYSN